MERKVTDYGLVFMSIHFFSLFTNVYVCQCQDTITQLKRAKRNGYSLATSNCENNYVSNWNTINIAKELKGWFESITVITKNDKSNNFKNRNYVKLSQNIHTDVVIVTSIGRLISIKDKSEINFKGWTKSLYTSNDQFHDGFYYGLMKGINGTITGMDFFKILHFNGT